MQIKEILLFPRFEVQQKLMAQAPTFLFPVEQSGQIVLT